MTVGEIAQALSLAVLAGRSQMERKVTAGYASDMLSCVMAKARQGNLWVTLQAHPNIVAVAVLLELAGIVVTEGAHPDAATLKKADEEGIAILSSPKGTFTVVGQLAQQGIQGVE